MGKKKRRQVTEKELHQIEAWAAIRLPQEEMVHLLQWNLTDFRAELNRNEALRRAVDEGRARSKVKVRRTLYEHAVGRRQTVDEKTGEVQEAIPPNMRALEFWCKTQEGMRVADRLELSGPDGGPMETHEVSKEELKARLAVLRQANDLTEDE